MPHHRPTHTLKAAKKYLPYYEELLAQIKSGKPQGMFLDCGQLGGVSPLTLQVRWGDALRWLMLHNIDDKIDRREEFEYLKAVTKTKRETYGLRIFILCGPKVEETIRDNKVAETPLDWKDKIENFLQDQERTVGVFENLVLLPPDVEWVKRTVEELFGSLASVNVNGDKLIIVKPE